MRQPNPMTRPERSAPAERLHLAERMSDIEPFHVVVLVTRAGQLEAEGRSIVNMVIGEPDFPTPRPIVEAGIEALRRNQIRYSPSLGATELRERLSHWYRSRYRIAVPPARIAVTGGSSGALLLTMGVLLSPGDEVLMADPGYPCNRHFVRAMEGRAVGIPVGPDSAYQLTAQLVERHWGERTVAVMVASPSNPTGTLIPAQELRRIHEVVRSRGGRLIVDEIYHGLTYGCDAGSVLEFADDVFVVSSFSKYFCMTGWRLGWLVAPREYAGPIEKLAQNLYISNSDIAQQAALAAFAPETIAELEGNRAKFQAQRDFLLPELRKLGFEIPVEPQGAFYIYANCSRLTSDSYRFCHDVLERAGVAIAPGIDFGAHRAAEHVRFSYPKPIPVLEEGVRRLGEYLKKA
jgi:aspartate/methionine/tyrosine aminotransferase